MGITESLRNLQGIFAPEKIAGVVYSLSPLPKTHQTLDTTTHQTRAEDSSAFDKERRQWQKLLAEYVPEEQRRRVLPTGLVFEVIFDGYRRAFPLFFEVPSREEVARNPNISWKRECEERNSRNLLYYDRTSSPFFWQPPTSPMIFFAYNSSASKFYYDIGGLTLTTFRDNDFKKIRKYVPPELQDMFDLPFGLPVVVINSILRSGAPFLFGYRLKNPLSIHRERENRNPWITEDLVSLPIILPPLRYEKVGVEGMDGLFYDNVFRVDIRPPVDDKTPCLTAFSRTLGPPVLPCETIFEIIGFRNGFYTSEPILNYLNNANL